MTRISGSADSPEIARARRSAYQRVNWLLAHAGVTLTLAGVSPNSPEVQAIRRALGAVNEAGGLGHDRKEASHAFPPGGARFGQTAG